MDNPLVVNRNKLAACRDKVEYARLTREMQDLRNGIGATPEQIREFYDLLQEIEDDMQQ